MKVETMEPSFWQKKWEKNEIAFHQSEINPMLVSHFHELSLTQGSRVFVPMCGKTRDISWLLSNGYRVAGAELSQIAVEQLFDELGIVPRRSEVGQSILFSAENIDIFVGDLFELWGDVLGPVDAIYDRAALVALPEEMRRRYSAHIIEITDTAPQLLICYEYDQSEAEGPPFSVTGDEVNLHYGTRYSLALVATSNVPGGLKGKCAATENVWLLKL